MKNPIMLGPNYSFDLGMRRLAYAWKLLVPSLQKKRNQDTRKLENGLSTPDGRITPD
jgi:hypothetical protein